MPEQEFLQIDFDTCVLDNLEECDYSQNRSVFHHKSQMGQFCGHDDVSRLPKRSERPNGQKRGSAEPERFGHFHRTFGRTSAKFGQIYGPKLTKTLLPKVRSHFGTFYH